MRAQISTSTKLRVLRHLQQCGNVKATARRFSTPNIGIQPSQIRRWREQEHELKLKWKKSSDSKSIHDGPKVHNEQLENNLYNWIMDQRQHGIRVTTFSIITKALSMDSEFKSADQKLLRYWVYQFLHRRALTVRVATRVGQKLSGHLHSVRVQFVGDIMERFQSGMFSDVPANMFVNMDETAVYFEGKEKTTIDAVGSRTVHIRSSGGSNQRVTVCTAAACDGTKLPLFVIFKGEPNARVEKWLNENTPPNIYACCQPKAWMDDRVMGIWFEKIWKPYIQGHAESVLLLDDFKCHKQEQFEDELDDVGTYLELIPRGYTSVLQPCGHSNYRRLCLYAL